MGRPKLLLPFRGRPLLEWTVGLVERLPVDHRVIVLGAEAREVQSAMALTGWRVAVNSRWPEGMASSLQAGEAAAPPGGLLILLGDMPCVPEEACLAIISQAGDVPMAPSYSDLRGFPVYLPPALRPRLHELRGDCGARSLLGECRSLPQGDPGVMWDVDKAGDLACDALRD